MGKNKKKKSVKWLVSKKKSVKIQPKFLTTSFLLIRYKFMETHTLDARDIGLYITSKPVKQKKCSTSTSQAKSIN